MAKEQTVIYTARTMQDAHLLKNLLAEQHIEAIVLNDVLEGGSGVDAVGWSTSARVVVDAQHATVAQQFAVRFDRKLASTPSQPMPDTPLEDDTAMMLDDWPTCPECNARRTTRCLICGTAGTQFPPVDMGFQWIPNPGDLAGSKACHCGPDGCTSDNPETDPQPAGEVAEPDSPPTMLMCPTCDEPFVPEYARFCEWCGHEFEDGYEVKLSEGPAEQVSGRVVAVMVGLAVLLTGIIGYFVFVFSGPPKGPS